jgi:hypothetical protein
MNSRSNGDFAASKPFSRRNGMLDVAGEVVLELRHLAGNLLHDAVPAIRIFINSCFWKS